MSSFIQTIQNIFKIEELRSRIITTVLILIVVRIGAQITLPGIDVAALQAHSANQGNDLFGLFDLFVGGAFSNAAIFALGIMPYITTSIILQLGGVVIPELQKLQKEGEEGRRKINQWTRIGTVAIAALQGWAVSIRLLNMEAGGVPVVPVGGAIFVLTTVFLLTAGVMFLMWLGEQITEKGIGNGISLIIMVGIIARLPGSTWQEINQVFQMGDRPWPVEVIIFLLLFGIIASVIFITQGARKIPVQYAKRQVGRKVYGGTTQYIPLRVNTAGVMPIIFAQSLMFIPNTILSFFPDSPVIYKIASVFSERSFVYAGIYGVMVVLFTYFYTAIIFNPKDMADNMKKQGGFIPGIRPGKPTSEYIDTILTRITLPGSLFLALIAIMPTFATNIFGVTTSFASFFGGTSLLIMVGVVLDTLQQIESYLLMRHYDGFMKSGKMKGRVGSGGF
ncbi:MAG TPA: preprotein translocase subunit SecY [Candidatus Kapabacteria bacterium]|mgnify:CR=1 FL=1|nr:preprotein translocase subunit SecY [Candidatus Kapabacteria bacterium]HPO63297.1 preprotein translocase subunit SecY [Candidatus Kapabacteria bacterium]